MNELRVLLVSPLGFAIGVSLGALGGGGSILAVPALVYGAGMDPKAATTTSLLIVAVTAATGMIAHWRAGRVRVASGLVFSAVGIGGSLLGSRLNAAVDPQVLLLAFSGLMLVAAWRMWASARRLPPLASTAPAGPTPAGPTPAATASPVEPVGPGRSGDPATSGVAVAAQQATTPATTTGIGDASVGPSTARSRPAVDLTTVVKVIVAGTVVGFLTGFFGVGGGFVIVPALVLTLHYPMPEAVGTSLLVIAANSAFTLSQRVQSTGIDWRVAGPFVIAAVLGVAAGKRLADRLPASTLSRWFVGLLVVLAVYIATRSVLAM